MQQQQALILTLAAGFLLRVGLGIVFPDLPSSLDARVEISTPITSFKRLKEGVFLYNHGLSPYDGGVFHQAPILLSLFAPLDVLGVPDLIYSIIFAVIDVLNGWILASTIKGNGPKYTIAAIYLLNPFLILTNLARCTIVFNNCAILSCIYYGVRGNKSMSMFFLALACHLSFYPCYLLIPLGVVCYKASNSRDKWKYGLNIAILFVLWCGVIFGLGYLISPGYLSSTYGPILLVYDLTPNIGVWWYFFTELFDYFQPFFLSIFQLHIVIYILPVTYRVCNSNSLFGLITCIGLIGLFKSYPSIGDSGLYLSLLIGINWNNQLLWNNCRYLVLSGLVIIYACVLGPIFYHLWIFQGSGNSNFFYAITLVYTLGISMVIIDSVLSVLTIEFDHVGGRKVIQI